MGPTTSPASRAGSRRCSTPQGCSLQIRSLTAPSPRQWCSITRTASSHRPRSGSRRFSGRAWWPRPRPARPRQAASRPMASWSCWGTTSPGAGWASELSEADLAERFRSGDVRALARAISLVEKRDPSVRALQDELADRARAYVVGFTGAPGTGKSTLVDALVSALRKDDRSVAVIATDPNSPFTGGAILGDRKAWKPPIIATSAVRQEGIEELWSATEAHRKYLTSTGKAEQLAADRLKEETAEVAAELARDRVRQALADDPALTERLLQAGTPYGTAEEILDRKR